MMSDRIPVLMLTARQFLEGRSIRIVILLAAVPLLLVGIEILAVGTDINVRSTLGNSYNELSIPTLLPLVSLILASTAFGNEISDRTLVYLVLKPWSRMRIVQEKYLATSGVGITILVSFAFLIWVVTSGLASDFDGDLLLGMIVAAALAIAAYSAAFTLLSLLITRVLMAGLLYVLIWESLLARFIPGLRLLSIRHYVQSIYAHIIGDGTITVSQQSAASNSLIVLAGIIGVSLILGWLRLQQMDLD